MNEWLHADVVMPASLHLSPQGGKIFECGRTLSFVVFVVAVIVFVIVVDEAVVVVAVVGKGAWVM